MQRGLLSETEVGSTFGVWGLNIERVRALLPSDGRLQGGAEEERYAITPTA